MGTTAIFRNFTMSHPWRNKYTRARRLYDIWDANLHHGDVRPFACPELVCEDVGELTSLYANRSCPCLGFTDGRKVVHGFDTDQYFFLEGGRLVETDLQGLCRKQYISRSGSPFYPERPEVTEVPVCWDGPPDDELKEARAFKFNDVEMVSIAYDEKGNLITEGEGDKEHLPEGKDAAMVQQNREGRAARMEALKEKYADKTKECDFVSVSYVITYVTQGAGGIVEGAPSPPSLPIASRGDVPGVTVHWDAAPDEYADHNIIATRLYRTTIEAAGQNHSPDGVEWVLVREFEGSGARTFLDNVPTTETGQPLLTYDPMHFPAPPGLKHILRTDTSIIVADDHKVYISLPRRPMFTWDGMVTVDDAILEMVFMRDSIVILTDDKPVIIQFKDDDVNSIVRSTIERHLPLVSKRSVSLMDDRLIFASEYSLYVWNFSARGSDIRSILQPYMTPDQWKAIKPFTVVGTWYEFGYIFSAEGMDFSIMLDLKLGGGSDTQKDYSMMPISYIKNPSVFGLDSDGHIVYVENGNFYRWDYRRDVCEDYRPYENLHPSVCDTCDCCPWEIKLYYNNSGKNNFSHMRVTWDERSAPNLWASFHIEEFGEEMEHSDEMKVISSRAFGIPYRNVGYRSVYAKVRGCGIMHEVKFATSAQEIAYNSNASVQGDEPDE